MSWDRFGAWALIAAGGLVACEADTGFDDVVAVAGMGGQDAGADTGGEAGSAGGTVGLLGAECERTDDCDEGLVCLTDQSEFVFGGGPARGFCTLNCTITPDGGVNPCEALPDAQCVDLSVTDEPNAWCLPTCVTGADGSNKCGNRLDVACTPAATAGTEFDVCVPVCAEDTDCTGGRLCDPKTNVCVNAADVSTGDPLAVACELEGGTCAGTCLPNPDNIGFCSQRCVVGHPQACGTGVCFFGSTEGATTGDEGFCAALCDSQLDCVSPALFCDMDPAWVSTFGRGVCRY